MSIDLRKRMAELAPQEKRPKPAVGSLEWKEQFIVLPGEIAWWDIVKRGERCKAREKQRIRMWHKQHPRANAEGLKRLMERNPGYFHKVRRMRNKKTRLGVISLLGGKCSKCGITDWKVLEVNHVNGKGKEDREKYRSPQRFYEAILKGERGTEGLSLLCANCNILYEYEVGRRLED